MRWVSALRTRRGLGCLLVLLTVAVVWLADPVRSADQSPVAAAAKKGDLGAVRALIQQRADVNLPEADGSTALLWAAYNSDLPMARALLTAGAKVDAANRYGVTPLLQASRVGDTAVMEALLDAGASVLTRHTEGETPLMATARAGSVPAVRLLLSRGADVNAADGFQRQTALMWAADEGHLDVIRALLEAGAAPDLKAHVNQLDREHADHPSGGFTALMFATRNGHEEAVRMLMEAGANPNLTNGDDQNRLSGATALIIAIQNDRFDLAAKMLEWGADPNDGSLLHAVDMHDGTTDMYARDGSQLRPNHRNTLTSLDLIKLLLEKGADPNKPWVGQLHNTSMCCGDFHNATPFYRAAIAADVEALTLLIAHGANVEWAPGELRLPGRGGRGGNGNMYRQPIFVAMTGGRGASFGAGPGFSREGPPPWREPGSRKPIEAVRLLLEAGADPNAWGPDGAVPLHGAADRGDLDMIRLLAEKGADLNYYNRDGYTALGLVEKKIADARSGRGRGGRGGDMDMNMGGGRGGATAAKPEEVQALLRELMGLPPAPPPAPVPAAEPEADQAAADQAAGDAANGNANANANANGGAQ
ncbi:MAG: ankyrin repeat domain-containing protein [Acidobacteria bacterium]|nr:ankyrin repeat domain-containing protein [Acidobacteriota bacterium]